MPEVPISLPDLLHRHVLVVEDEYLQADALRMELEEYDAVVVGPVSGVEDALTCIASTPELAAAILDVELQGETSEAIADTLLRRGVPFVFVTGYTRHQLAARYDGTPVVTKPATVDALVAALTG